MPIKKFLMVYRFRLATSIQSLLEHSREDEITQLCIGTKATLFPPVSPVSVVSGPAPAAPVTPGTTPATKITVTPASFLDLSFGRLSRNSEQSKSKNSLHRYRYHGRDLESKIKNDNGLQNFPVKCSDFQSERLLFSYTI